MGGDRPSSRLSPISIVAEVSGALKLPISPLVGEMPGRAEGGAKDRYRTALVLPLSGRSASTG
ncbi:hypothetical protein EOC94_23725 [Mesorhizobium sp. M6A.T.Ce.TU.016.01.1.1]|nr:hypothetical protein EOC94_23725 [Mesorhizobium sp. M6A.T.Ce.TU.016.01.1.1]